MASANDGARDPFSIFVTPGFQEIVCVKQLANAVAAQTWAAWMQCECVTFDGLEGLDLRASGYLDEVSDTAVTLPSSSMAAWVPREVLMCKINMLRPQDRQVLGACLETAVVHVDEREEDCNILNRLTFAESPYWSRETCLEELGMCCLRPSARQPICVARAAAANAKATGRTWTIPIAKQKAAGIAQI